MKIGIEFRFLSILVRKFPILKVIFLIPFSKIPIFDLFPNIFFFCFFYLLILHLFRSKFWFHVDR